VELHALQLVIDIEGDILSLSALPALPKESVIFIFLFSSGKQ